MPLLVYFHEWYLSVCTTLQFAVFIHQWVCLLWVLWEADTESS